MVIGKFLSKVRVSKIVFSVVILLGIALTRVWIQTKVISFDEVRGRYKPSDVWIVDREGYPLESIRTRGDERSLEWVPWAEVSPVFKNLLVQEEDHRFYSHPGVDFLALAKAALEKMTGRSNRGASTLTMQVVGLLDSESRLERRSVSEKLIQIVAALKMSMLWSKPQVLEAYVNLVAFRGELVGLRATSLGYFSKNPIGLVDEEAALLVALLRSPNASAGVVGQRACRILKSKNCQSIRSQADSIFSKPYRLARARQLVPVLEKSFVESKDGASVIKTSLDYRTQELAIKAMQEQLSILKSQNVNDAAVLVLETQTGRVVAYVANAGAGIASAEQVDGVRMRRQAGSTLKPFVYATAFDWRLLRPNSLLEDSPADITVSHGRVYHPRNYDHIFRGFVGVGEALGSSMNVPAVRALQMVGEVKVLERLRALGFQNLQDDDYYGPSLALGAIDVTLWELTNGYRQLATNDATFSFETRQSIFNILSSAEYRRFTFGMDSLLALPFRAAVKTGTSKDMRDNWCIGWTSKYTVGVWIGNFSGQPMWNVSGTSGAAPIWRHLMLALHTERESTIAQYEAPSEPLPQRTISRIRYPAPDMLVGLDPDIPKTLQKLPIEIENPQQGHKLYLNGKWLAESQKTVLWPIKKGKYVVELKSINGKQLDSIKFEVR